MKSGLVNAAIVRAFPVLECRLHPPVDLGLHTLFIGEIVGLVADDEALVPNTLPDIEKVRPPLWGSMGSKAYSGIGAPLAAAFSVKKLRQTLKGRPQAAHIIKPGDGNSWAMSMGTSVSSAGLSVLTRPESWGRLTRWRPPRRHGGPARSFLTPAAGRRYHRLT